MKASIYSVLFAMVISLSASVHAIPPVPPTPAKEGPAAVICKDANALTVEEIEELNQDPESIVSFDAEIREICYKK